MSEDLTQEVKNFALYLPRERLRGRRYAKSKGEIIEIVECATGIKLVVHGRTG